MFESKNVEFKISLVVIVAVSFLLVSTWKESLAQAESEGIADQTIGLMEAPLKQELGPGQIESKYEKSEIYGTVVAFDFCLQAGVLDSTWGAKAVRVLNELGATDAKITATSDVGPTEVRAESLQVGEMKAMSVQCVPSSEGDCIGWSIMFPGGMLNM